MRTKSYADWTLLLFIASTLTLVQPCTAGAAQDLDALKERGVLRHLGVPYANFVSGAGDGLSVDLMRLFAKHLGVRYEYVDTTFASAIPDLTGKVHAKDKSGKAVVQPVPAKGDVIAAGLTVLAWREELVAFSDPSFPTQVWLITAPSSALNPITPSNDLEADIRQVKKMLRGRSLLVKAGTCLDPTLYKLSETGAKLMEFPGGLHEIFPAMLQGGADATILDVPDALIAMKKWAGQVKIIGPVSSEQQMAEAFRKEDRQLRQAYNDFLNQCRKDGTYIRLIQKYYPDAVYYYSKFFEGCAAPQK
jgi:ABC-type amino acid transport substrate-binding protein